MAKTAEEDLHARILRAEMEIVKLIQAVHEEEQLSKKLLGLVFMLVIFVVVLAVVK